MAKKIIMIGFAIIVFCLCSSICFAKEGESVNLGNEVMQSIDKTGESINNVVSGNVIRDGMNDEEGTMNMNNNERNNQENGKNNENENNRDNNENNMDNRGKTESYDAMRTSTEGDIQRGTSSLMSTTTWMWIILAMAAIIIIAAIWYYATQNNE